MLNQQVSFLGRNGVSLLGNHVRVASTASVSPLRTASLGAVPPSWVSANSRAAVLNGATLGMWPSPMPQGWRPSSWPAPLPVVPPASSAADAATPPLPTPAAVPLPATDKRWGVVPGWGYGVEGRAGVARPWAFPWGDFVDKGIDFVPSPPTFDNYVRSRGLGGIGDTDIVDYVLNGPSAWVLFILRMASAGLSAFHGYKRSGKVSSAALWGICGGIAPVITPAIAFAQGFAKPGPSAAVAGYW